MPLSTATLQKSKTKEELEKEVPAGGVRFDKDTKVVALELGYSDVLRQAGEVFYVKKGTIMGPNCWFQPVDEKTTTTDDETAYENMTVAELKVALAKKGVDFAGITRKQDLIDLLAKAEQEDDLA